MARIESVSSAQTKALPKVSLQLTQALKIAWGVLRSTTCATATTLKFCLLLEYIPPMADVPLIHPIINIHIPIPTK